MGWLTELRFKPFRSKVARFRRSRYVLKGEAQSLLNKGDTRLSLLRPYSRRTGRNS